jgi:hypothetical protein
LQAIQGPDLPSPSHSGRWEDGDSQGAGGEEREQGGGESALFVFSKAINMSLQAPKTGDGSRHLLLTQLLLVSSPSKGENEMLYVDSNSIRRLTTE